MSVAKIIPIRKLSLSEFLNLANKKNYCGLKELSDLRREIYTEFGWHHSITYSFASGCAYWTGFGIGRSSRNSIFKGEIIFARISRVDGEGNAIPDYRKAIKVTRNLRKKHFDPGCTIISWREIQKGIFLPDVCPFQGYDLDNYRGEWDLGDYFKYEEDKRFRPIAFGFGTLFGSREGDICVTDKQMRHGFLPKKSVIRR